MFIPTEGPPPRILSEKIGQWARITIWLLGLIFRPDQRPLLHLAYLRVDRGRMRLLRLVEKWEAGTLPRASTRPKRERVKRERKGFSAPPGMEVAPEPPGRGWVYRIGQSRTASSGQELRALLEEPEMGAFLEAAPQAKRIIRPLWRMLDPGAMPGVLALPPRPRKAKAGRPAPAVPKETPPVGARPRRVASAEWPRGVMDPPRRRQDTVLG